MIPRTFQEGVRAGNRTFSTFSTFCAHNDKAISLLHLRYNLPVSLRQVARVRVVAPAAATWPYSADSAQRTREDAHALDCWDNDHIPQVRRPPDWYNLFPVCRFSACVSSSEALYCSAADLFPGFQHRHTLEWNAELLSIFFSDFSKELNKMPQVDLSCAGVSAAALDHTDAAALSRTRWRGLGCRIPSGAS